MTGLRRSPRSSVLVALALVVTFVGIGSVALTAAGLARPGTGTQVLSDGDDGSGSATSAPVVTQTLTAGAKDPVRAAPTPSVAATLPRGHQTFATLTTNTGRLLVTRLIGAASGVSLRVWVWLPPQYDDPRYAHTAFPALMLYPGGSGAGYNTWAGTQYHAREEDAAGATEGRLTPFVFVMPEMQPSEHLDTECTDLPGQPKVGTFLTVDVRQMILDNFRVMADRTGWGAAGASSGAYCAARVVFNHPDQYAAVVSIAGYFTIETTLPGHADPVIRAADPAAIATAAPPAVSALLWAGGRNGPDLRDARGFLSRVRSPTAVELRILAGGRHLTSDFAKMMPGSLTFLSAHLAHPTPIR